jgi:hypothetical protein
MMRSVLFAVAIVAAGIANADIHIPVRVAVARIDVSNTKRVSPELIIAESLLRPGRDYSEEELEAARMRVARLPFVAEVHLFLREESDPYSRVVVLAVTETTAFSFLVDARGVKLGESRTGLDTDYAFPDPAAPWKHAAAGVRRVIGKGEAHFAMTVLRNRLALAKNYSAWELGYTAYDLFGTGVFATVKVRTPVDSVGESTFTPAFSIGMPLTFTQTISVEVEDTLFRDDDLTIAGDDFRRLDAERKVTLDWTYDTTDEPYAPSKGTFVRIAPMLWMKDFESVLSARPGQPARSRTDHTTAYGLEVAALRHWELYDVHSVSVGVMGGWADAESRSSLDTLPDRQFNTSYEILQAGYSRRLGKARLGIEARGVAYQENVFDDAVEVSLNWTRRWTWGTVRLGAGYVSAY